MCPAQPTVRCQRFPTQKLRTVPVTGCSQSCVKSSRAGICRSLPSNQGVWAQKHSQRTSAPEKSEKHAPTSFSATLGHSASLVEHVPVTSSCTPRAQASPAPSWGRRLRYKQGPWHGYFVIQPLPAVVLHAFWHGSTSQISQRGLT